MSSQSHPRTLQRRQIGQPLFAWACGTPRIRDTPIAHHVSRQGVNKTANTALL
jgi:hypothetical protein